MEKPHFALRLYENAKYGLTRGKGLRHQALYNGTIDLQCPRVKYLVDVTTYDHWEEIYRTASIPVCINELSRTRAVSVNDKETPLGRS
jgi:hypothetical protein